MLKIFSILTQDRPAAPPPAETPDWLRDPLAHPDIAAMDARALGDLPFGLFRPPARDGERIDGQAAWGCGS